MRKRGLALACAAVMAMSLVGCGGGGSTATTAASATTAAQTEAGSTAAAETTTAAAENTAVDTSQKEAPMLAEQVAAGTLPALEERIPTDGDAMVEEMESLGQYGGSIQFAFQKAGWSTGKPIEQGLFRFKEDGTVEPNVAKGYDVNEDATEYTIYLRKGMKWSDGVPFTAEDCVFFYDHMCKPATFGKSLWDCFKVANPENPDEVTEAEFEKVDDTTFKVKFQYSKPSFIENLAINAKWCFAPKHYHEQILAEFIGEEAAKQKATEMGFSDAAAMGKETGYYFWNVSGIPTLNPWVLSTESGKNDVDGDYYEYVRNPYYWKVDSEGRQLPYIDKLEITRISDASQTLLKTLEGSVTINDGANWADIATLQENAEKGGYHLIQWSNGQWADIRSQVHLNLTDKDEDYRALFNNIDFRQALSIAVDRKEYASLLSDGWQDGAQAAPAEGTMGYDAEWAAKWTEYDPAAAQTLIEGCGMVKGSDGYWDFANGKDFVLNLSTNTESGSDESAELLMKYYDAIGIKCTYKPVSRELMDNMTTSNDFDAVIGPVVPAETISIILRPDTLVPVRNYAAWYSQVGNWYASRGAEGVAPEGGLLELCNLYDQLKVEVDSDKQMEIAQQMLDLHKENTWVLGYMAAPTTLIAVKDNFKNFPETSVYCDEFRGLGIAHIECCYFAD
ncbi:MAG: ABC transporter substrate-binding protein [bacterium]|nr:ABC transporter substrate-binding protein [bacterium]